MFNDLLILLFSNPNDLKEKNQYLSKKESFSLRSPNLISAVYPTGKLRIPVRREKANS
jgi:hypothetical protein